MTITLNGETRIIEDTEKCSVSVLLEKLALGPQPVLVELNGEALYERDFRQTTVNDGDDVEIIRMVAGG